MIESIHYEMWVDTQKNRGVNLQLIPGTNFYLYRHYKKGWEREKLDENITKNSET